MKLQRQAAILRIVRERRIGNQEELRQVLAETGIEVTQATLSRDLRDLGLAKRTDGDGSYYTAPAGMQPGPRPDLSQILPALLIGIDGVGPLLVLRTASGAAGAISSAIDQAGWRELIGTIAGDDTVLLIARSPQGREEVAARIRELAR